MAEYPYLRSNKNLPQIFEKIRTAAKPPKFTIAFVKQLGFTSSNDAAYPSLLKKTRIFDGRWNTNSVL